MMERQHGGRGRRALRGVGVLIVAGLVSSAVAACDRIGTDRPVAKAGAAAPPTASPPTAPVTTPPAAPVTTPPAAPAQPPSGAAASTSSTPPPEAPAATGFGAVPRPPAGSTPFKPVDPRIAIAKSMLSGGRYTDAQRALEVILRDHPGTAQAEMLLGVAMQKQKRYVEALPRFEKAIALRQSFPEVDHLFHFLGWCEYYLSDMEAARLAFEEHLRRVPDEPDSTFGLALVALEEDRIDEAERLLLRSIASLRDEPAAQRDIAKARIRLGDVYVRLDRFDDAERELREALRLYPDHYEGWAKLARLLDRADRPVEAERARSEEQAAMRRAGRAPSEPPSTAPERPSATPGK